MFTYISTKCLLVPHPSSMYDIYKNENYELMKTGKPQKCRNKTSWIDCEVKFHCNHKNCTGSDLHSKSLIQIIDYSIHPHKDLFSYILFQN